MEASDVVITGVGMVTPIGNTAAETWAAWQAGVRPTLRSCPELKGTPLQDVQVAHLPPFDRGERLGGRRLLKYMSAPGGLGCVAAREAMEEARAGSRFDGDRVGLFAASGLAAARLEDIDPIVRDSIDEDGRFSSRLLGSRGLAQANPLLSFKILANMPACLISILEGIRGPSYVFTPWEGQTGAAVLEAREALSSREVDCALVGASDDATHAVTILFLHQAGLLAPGETAAAGAAYLVLERRETAERDGIRPHAVLLRAGLRASRGEADDPLVDRLGRTFAAAPAILLALGCRWAPTRLEIRGADGQAFDVELGAAS